MANKNKNRSTKTNQTSTVDNSFNGRNKVNQLTAKAIKKAFKNGKSLSLNHLFLIFKIGTTYPKAKSVGSNNHIKMVLLIKNQVEIAPTKNEKTVRVIRRFLCFLAQRCLSDRSCFKTWFNPLNL